MTTGEAPLKYKAGSDVGKLVGMSQHPVVPTLLSTYASSFPPLVTTARPDIPPATRVAYINAALAKSLGLDPAWLASAEGLAWLTGGQGSERAKTYALGYSGFQFGQLSPILGDGRAHLIGEFAPSIDAAAGGYQLAQLRDFHLKGSGLTPYSRTGSDGKAPLTAIWRELVVGEYLHAMGVPTGRILAVLETGQMIHRREPHPIPAGIGVRVAESHLRVGTFQFAQYTTDEQTRHKLVQYALDRHYPGEAEGLDAGERALALLRLVGDRQAQLTARWQALGFVHGVLNTDNVTISGQAIDFGPCAFIDTFNHHAVFSSIDGAGRYRYSNQPVITAWNLARFGESLLDLIDSDNPNRAVHLATDQLDQFDAVYRRYRAEQFASKLGITGQGLSAADYERINDLIDMTLNHLESMRLDFTGFFRTLTDTPSQLEALVGTGLASHIKQLREQTGTSAETSQCLMQESNPVYIPRNTVLESALVAVQEGDLESITELVEILATPMVRKAGRESLESPVAQVEPFVTFCGT